MVLCLPSLACMDRIGEKIGDGRVDQFGDVVLCQKLPGDGCRIRHDRVKTEIFKLTYLEFLFWGHALPPNAPRGDGPDCNNNLSRDCIRKKV